MEFIKLTALNGKAVLVNRRSIAVITDCITYSAIFIVDGEIAEVKESIKEIEEILRRAE